MFLMRNPVQPYQWGSRTAIASLMGRTVPSSEPEAEVWIGAHPENSSSVIMGATECLLSDVIAADPVAGVGAEAQTRFGARLPFLLKVLAADAPLSLQAHPTKDQAAAGFDAEDAAMIPLGSPQRNYRDRSDKPELICALTDFHALCGFRDVDELVALLTELDVRALDPLVGMLSRSSPAVGTRAYFLSVMSMRPADLAQLLPDVLRSCADLVNRSARFGDDFRVALELAERFDRDPGVLVSLMMNRVTLTPGEAMFVPAGTLHSYLAGTGVEIMANSDNVLRGGLTAKHVDVPQLTKVLSFEPGTITVLHGRAHRAGERVFLTPTPEFRLARWELADQSYDIACPGAQIVLVVEGEARLDSGDGSSLTLAAGQSAWIPSSCTQILLTGNGLAFTATTGLPPQSTAAHLLPRQSSPAVERMAS